MLASGSAALPAADSAGLAAALATAGVSAGLAAGAILIVGAALDFVGAVVVEHYWYVGEVKLMYIVSGIAQFACGFLLLLDRDIRTFCTRMHKGPI